MVSKPSKSRFLIWYYWFTRHTILLCRFFCEKNHDFAGFLCCIRVCHWHASYSTHTTNSSLIQTMVTWKRKIYDASCLSKMMILLMFVLCCYVFQVSVAVLVSSREDFLVFIWKWKRNVKISLHPVYQKWWFHQRLFCVVVFFRFLWLC